MHINARAPNYTLILTQINENILEAYFQLTQMLNSFTVSKSNENLPHYNSLILAGYFRSSFRYATQKQTCKRQLSPQLHSVASVLLG